jgi:hypothetical protein
MVMAPRCSIIVPNPPNFGYFCAIVVVLTMDGVLAITTPIVTTEHHDANNLRNMQKKNLFPYVCGCCCTHYASNNINIKEKRQGKREKIKTYIHKK